MVINDGGFRGGASGTTAVTELGTIAREREKTKRMLIGAACLFFAIAALIVVFAPSGREKLAYILGAALLVMALGAIGAAQFRLKVPGVEVDTRLNQPENAKPTKDMPRMQ
jgi:hypothetical protein